MPGINDFVTLSTVLRFVTPAFTKQQWTDHDNVLKDKLKPIHSDLANKFITPQEAGCHIAGTISDYLAQQPELLKNIENNIGYIKQPPKTVSEAKLLKKSLRKQIQQKDALPSDRKRFGQAVRYHNHLVKEQRKRDILSATKHQGKMYRDNFWEFSKKLCQGSLDKGSHKPSFSKAEADEYYPRMYCPHL